MPFQINTSPAQFIGVMLAFIIGSTFHEFMHAYTAWRLGDDTARRAGRVSLNPVVHFDPFGFFLFLLIALGVGFFAYAKPVMVNPGALRWGRRGMALVAFAGPFSNLVLGAVLAIPFRLGLLQFDPTPGPGATLSEQAVAVYSWVVFINFLLFAFNLIPIPPLDGFNVLTGVASNRWALLLAPLARYGFAPILVLLFVPYLLQNVGVHIDLIGPILNPVISVIRQVFIG